MHRIDTSTAQKDKFGPGKNGFTEGSPQTGVPPTALNAAFFDSVQEEICSVIEDAGIELDPDQNNQLLAAIRAIMQSGGEEQLGTAAKADLTTSYHDSTKDHVMKVGDFGLGLENADSTGIDFTTYIFCAGEVLKLHIQDCQNVPAPFANESDVYVQCIGVRNQAYGCGLIFSVYNHPEKTYIAQREDNTNGNWQIIQIGNADMLSGYLALTGGTLSGPLTLEDCRIMIDEPNPGNVPDGTIINSEAYCFRLLGRGALDDPEGATAKIYYSENVGTSNQIVIHINGFGNDIFFNLTGDGDLLIPRSISAGGAVYPTDYSNFDARYLSSGATYVTGVRLANYGSVGKAGVHDSQQVVLTGIYDTNGWDNPTTQEFRQVQFEIAGQWYNAPYV